MNIKKIIGKMWAGTQKVIGKNHGDMAMGDDAIYVCQNNKVRVKFGKL